MADFYVKRGDHQFGPYKSSRLKQHADDGRVLPSDLVRQGEDGKWYPASSVKGLFSKEPVRQSADAQDATSELDPEAEDEAMALLMQSTDVFVAAPSTATAQDASPSSTPTEAPQPADTNSNLDACPDCGTMVSKRAAACPSCGAPLLEAEDSPELKACRDCGTMVPEQSAACPRCGIPFWDSERETAPSHKSPRTTWSGAVLFLAVTVAILLGGSLAVGIWMNPQAQSARFEEERNRQKFKQDMDGLDDTFRELGVGPPDPNEVPPRTEGRITSNVSYTLPARSVDELARKFFDAIKREDLAAYLDTAIPEKFTGQIVTAFPVSKQARLLDHFRTLRSRFEKKWKIEIIGRAAELGIEWKQTEFVTMRVDGLKTQLKFQRHGWMIIQFSHRGQDFYIELDDPTLVSGHWYFFDPMKTISTDPDTRWSRLGIPVPPSRRTRP